MGPSISDKKSERSAAELHACYDSAENPYNLALRFFAQNVNYQICKANSFTFYILEAFQSYVKAHPERHNLLDDDHRVVAFNLTNTDPNSSLFKLTASCFRFPEKPELFEDHVRTLMTAHKYAPACRFAKHCGVSHPDFVYGFLLPLAFSRNDAMCVYEYLETFPEQQAPFMSALDSLLTHNFEGELERLVLMYGYQNLCKANMTKAFLLKNIPKYRKRFNVPPSSTPNANRIQNGRAMEFWVSRLAMGDTDPTVFDDNVRNLVSRDDHEGQSVLINKLLQHKLGKEVIKWMEYFDITKADLPEATQKMIDHALENSQLMGRRITLQKERNAYAVDWRQINLNFVDSAAAFKDMLAQLNHPSVEVVGFDLEWPPTYNENASVSLMQLATNTHVFVIDMVAKCIPVELWRELGAFFNGSSALKIGYGCTQDVAYMAQLTSLGMTKQGLCNLVDFLVVWEILEKDYKEAIKSKKSSGRSLRDFVNVFLNKQLDKRMQMSDWSLRPLRPEQVIYAATDAYCLVDGYAEIKHRLAKRNIDILEAIDKYHLKRVKTR